MSRKPLIIALFFLAAALSMALAVVQVVQTRRVTQMAIKSAELATSIAQKFLEKEQQAGAVVIQETTVGSIGDTSIGIGNIGASEYKDQSGVTRSGITAQLSVWSTAGAAVQLDIAPIIVYPGFQLTIGDQSYRINLIWKTQGQNGWVSLLPVAGPEPDLSVLAPPETHVRKRNETELFLGPQEQWEGSKMWAGDGELSITVRGSGIVDIERIGQAVHYAYFLPQPQINELIQEFVGNNFLTIPTAWGEGSGAQNTWITLFNATGESRMIGQMGKMGYSSQPRFNVIAKTFLRLARE